MIGESVHYEIKERERSRDCRDLHTEFHLRSVGRTGYRQSKTGQAVCPRKCWAAGLEAESILVRTVKGPHQGKPNANCHY